MQDQHARILIVDDTPDNLSIISLCLEQMAYQIFVANDAQDIVERVKRVKPDLILLDIMMPVVDGYEACELLKADVETAVIPVIFLTANTRVEQMVRGFAVGGVDYITKPFYQSIVLARIHTHLSLYHLRKRLQEKNEALEEALLQVKQLTGLLPICADCKKIRNEEDEWVPVELYIKEHSQAEFTHGLCSDCLQKWYGNV